MQTEPEEKLSSSRQIIGQRYRPLYERLRWTRFLSRPSSSTTSKLPDMATMNWCSVLCAWPPRSDPPGTS
jgi:hypothetical protein